MARYVATVAVTFDVAFDAPDDREAALRAQDYADVLADRRPEVGSRVRRRERKGARSGLYVVGDPKILDKDCRVEVPPKVAHVVSR